MQTDTATATVYQIPELSIRKETDAEYYTHPGEIMNYTLVITNTGNVTLYDVSAMDSIAAVTCDPIPVLAPGDSAVCTASYMVSLDDIFATRPRDEWLKGLKENDFVCCEVNRPTELKDDPQILANDYIVEIEHPERGKTMIPGYPVHFGKAWAGTKDPAPRLGANTDEILAELGGYTAGEIAQLKAEGVV